MPEGRRILLNDFIVICRLTRLGERDPGESKEHTGNQEAIHEITRCIERSQEIARADCRGADEQICQCSLQAEESTTRVWGHNLGDHACPGICCEASTKSLPDHAEKCDDQG